MSSSLNAPFGARCFLSRETPPGQTTPLLSLNAPYGARCFLTAARQEMARREA